MAKEHLIKKPMRIPKPLVDEILELARQDRRSFTQMVNTMVGSQIRTGNGKVLRTMRGNTVLKTVDMPKTFVTAIEGMEGARTYEGEEETYTFTDAVVSILEKELRKKEMFGK